uniref:hypothetical protein n=1 Tax=Streptomyces chartreusis TaxID=1969 RepID=UPI003F496826
MLVDSDTAPTLSCGRLSLPPTGTAPRYTSTATSRTASAPLPTIDADLIHQLAAERTRLHRPW